LDDEEIRRIKARVLEFIKTRNEREATSSFASPQVQPPPAPAPDSEAAAEDPPRPESQTAGQTSSAEAHAASTAPGAEAHDTNVV